MGRKAKYTGGAWAIGGLMSQRHQERQQMPAQWRRGDLARMRTHALERISQGNRQYVGILSYLDNELDALNALTAEKKEIA